MTFLKFMDEHVELAGLFFGSGQDWMNFLAKQVGLVIPSVAVGRIDCIICGSGWHLSNFSQKPMGLVKLSAFQGKRDWTNLLQRQAGLVERSAGVKRIGQKFLYLCHFGRCPYPERLAYVLIYT